MAHPNFLSDIPPERLLSSFDETQSALSCSRSTVYKLGREGQIVLVKVGGRRYVVTQSIQDYVNRVVAEATSGRRIKSVGTAAT